MRLRQFARVHAAMILVAGLVVAGFVMMGLGWWGASRTVFVPAQVGYLLSGGVAGLLTLATGLTVLIVQRVRIATARRTRELAAVTNEAAEILARLTEHAPEFTAGGDR